MEIIIVSRRCCHKSCDEARRALEWREHSILTLETEGLTFNLNNDTETHSIFLKL
jgi:hypothetical protein